VTGATCSRHFTPFNVIVERLLESADRD